MDRYRTLLEVNDAVLNCSGREELLEAVTRVLKRIIPCDRAGVAFYDSNGDRDRRLFDEALLSCATAPLVVRGESIGVLGVGSAEPGKYGDDDREFIEAVACQVALAAANARAYEEVHTLKKQLRELQSALPTEVVADSLGDDSPRGESLGESLREIERRHIAATLVRCGWVIEGNRGAAKALGLHPNTLRHRLRKLELKRPSKVEN